MVRQWRRWGTWLAVVGALTVLALTIALAAVALRGPAPAPDQVTRFHPTPPPPPSAPLVMEAAGTDAPVPTAAGVGDAIDGLLDSGDLGDVGAVVVDVATGNTLYRQAPRAPAVPASTTKLVTAATVLATHDPSHRIPTVALAGADPGEVVLVGGGDPTLAVDGTASYPGAARLDDLASQVRDAFGDAPVTRVTVDSSRFTGNVHGPWDSHIPDSGYVGPITALMTDGGRVDPEQTDGAAERRDQPDLAAGRAFASLLDVDAPVTRGSAPPPSTEVPTGRTSPGSQLGRVSSPPMIRLVELMLTGSDNVVAEALARHVALARGQPASYRGAATAMAGVLAELGVTTDGSTLADGSGLSRDNRLTATLLTDLLVTAHADPELAGMFAGLPVAGWSGTLAERYHSSQPDTTPGAGVVRAKTGTLAGVSALAGLVVTGDGRLLAFALLANDAPAGAPEGLDRIAARLAACGCR